jgi:hypothetical protein
MTQSVVFGNLVSEALNLCARRPRIGRREGQLTKAGSRENKVESRMPIRLPNNRVHSPLHSDSSSLANPASGAISLRAEDHDSIFAGLLHRHFFLLQSSSASRVASAALGFFILSQSGERPERCPFASWAVLAKRRARLSDWSRRRRTALLATAGKANGRNLSLVMAGVVRHDRVNRMALAPNSYARPIRYATPANIQIPSL